MAIADSKSIDWPGRFADEGEHYQIEVSANRFYKDELTIELNHWADNDDIATPLTVDIPRAKIPELVALLTEAAETFKND